MSARRATEDTRGTATTHSAVALVTGGGSGIGRSAALRCARAGLVVAVVDVDAGSAARTEAMIRDEGGTAIAVRADVTQAADVESALAEAAARGELRWAINAAGTEGPSGRAADLSEADWANTLALNLTATWLCLREEVRRMPRGGSIVNIASVGGLAGYAGRAAYSASKHGVVGLTRSAAMEYARDGIRINAVCPGATDTPMLARVTGGDPVEIGRLAATKPLGRIATADEVADVAVWLCSDAAAQIVGQAIVVDGGMLAGRA